MTGNLLINNLGIDARFGETDAFMVGNRISGRIYARDDAHFEEQMTGSASNTAFDVTRGFNREDIKLLLSEDLKVGRVNHN